MFVSLCFALDCSARQDVINILIAQLGDEDKEVRGEASSVLYELNKESGGVVEALFDALEHENPYVRVGALETLGWIGSEMEISEGPVVKLLDDAEPLVRITAAETLGLIRGDAKDVLPILIEGLQDEDWEIRLESAFSFILFDENTNKELIEAIPYLIKLFDDEIEKIGLAAVCSLSFFGPVAVPELVKAVGHDKPIVRGRALRTLGLMGTDAADALPTVVQALEDGEGQVRSAAAIALANIDDEEAEVAIPILIEGLMDKESAIFHRSIEALSLIGPPAEKAIPRLLELIITSEGVTRIDIAFAIAQISVEHLNIGLNALMEELGNKDKTLRYWAIKHLGEIGPRAVAALPKLREISEKDKSELNRETALEAIEAIESSV
jgi:HEAT repeat protein